MNCDEFFLFDEKSEFHKKFEFNEQFLNWMNVFEFNEQVLKLIIQCTFLNVMIMFSISWSKFESQRIYLEFCEQLVDLMKQMLNSMRIFWLL